jgi:Fe-S-cluster-containing hydrogenase component 2
MEELKGSPGFPSQERLVKEAVTVIEGVQEIPCDVCGSICPHHALQVASVQNLPRLVEEECRGCGVCVPFCPDLAIFLVDYSYSGEETLIAFPHEFQPLPEVGASVEATDRQGRSSTKGRVVRVTKRANYDGTVVVSVCPKSLLSWFEGSSCSEEGDGNG